MNILAIETSTKRASVTVSKNRDLFSKNIENEITHSEKLLPLIDEMLKVSNVKLTDIDLFACTKGPGSFTGIRIGLSTIKGLAHVNSNNIFAISSLLLLAYTAFLEQVNKVKKNADSPMYFCPIMDAKNSRIYYSVYEFKIKEEKNNFKLSVKEILPASNDDIHKAMKNIETKLSRKKDSKIYFVGDCVTTYADVLKKDFKVKNNKIVIVKKNTELDSKHIISFINDLPKKDFTKNIYQYDNLNAVYARVSQAERSEND